YGVSCNAASPRLLGNNIQSFSIGLNCLNQSSPILENGTAGGNNVIKNNDIGVSCDNGSNAVLGLISGSGPPDDGGQNSIFNNTTYNVRLTNGCNVYAHNNWWGAAPPATDKFSQDETSKLYYEPYLPTDPNGGGSSPIGGSLIVERDAGISPQQGDDPRLDPLGDHPQMKLAVPHRIRSQYTSALTPLRGVIAGANELVNVKKWAVSELVANALQLRGANLSPYLTALHGQQPALYQMVRNGLVTSLLSERNIPPARTALEDNIRGYPNSSVECSGLYGKFAVALFSDHDVSAAQDMLTALSNRYRSSAERNLAAIQIRLEQNRTSALNGGGQGLTVQNAGLMKQDGPIEEQPLRFSLSQNFPNPFNPTTNIKHSIPEDAFVSLKVYDVLGREVAVLESTQKRAGSYAATFNASTLSSGIYISRLSVVPLAQRDLVSTSQDGRAGTYNEMRRMLLLK
ncbi:MAG: T9SS type A sorting domain-containing protein, partial [Bacteroidota bacterium]